MKALSLGKTARYLIAAFFSLTAIASFFLMPEKSKFFYPLFFASAAGLKRKDFEAKFLIVFAATLSALILPYFLKEGSKEYPIFVSQMLILWASLWTASEYFEKEDKKKEEENAVYEKEKKEAEELQKRAEFYKEHSAKSAERIRAGRIFLSSLKSIQTKNSSRDIADEVLKAVKESFKDCVCELKTKPDGDWLCYQIWQSKLPILIKNSKNDPRFKKENFSSKEASLLSAPILSFSAVFAAVKITSEKPDRLNESDLRTCELLLRSASIALENLALFSKINEMAMKDALTGLLTHRIFQDRLDFEILTSGRTKLPFSLIIADIDHFKKYNDSYGHRAGDEVLRKTAETLKNSLREIDICARYGGEEFAVILPQCSKEEAFKTAEKLRENISRISFNFDGKPSSITASFGIAVFPQDAPAKSRLIRVADERLYKAKQSGRNKVIYE
ncbi:MAG: GGDEF domain-containing protein [Elusimicrobia bacterium]|nr:GGDEF domain-containing protein [Elusimicrobiota bacterium]